MTGKRVPTEIDGIEVIAHEPGLATHPSPKMNGKIVPFTGVTRVLLADDTDRHVCDDCTFVGANTRSVVAHRNGTHNRTHPAGPIYPTETIRLLIREVRRAQAAKIRGYATHVAGVLNEMKVPTMSGRPWTATMVSGLFVHYRDRYRTQLPRAVKVAKTATPLDGDLASVSSWIQRMPEMYVKIIRLLEQLETTVVAEPDPELVEKARRWDAMQELMRGK